jgi:hypothetical protein
MWLGKAAEVVFWPCCKDIIQGIAILNAVVKLRVEFLLGRRLRSMVPASLSPDGWDLRLPGSHDKLRQLLASYECKRKLDRTKRTFRHNYGE